MAEFIAGLVSGGVLWELGKSGMQYWLNEKKAKRNLQLNTLLTQIQGLKDRVEPLWLLASRYYGDPSAANLELSREITLNMASFAREWGQVNRALEAFGYDVLKGHCLISFRQAITMHLEDCGGEAISISHPIAERLSSTVVKISDEIQRIQILLHS